jgi:ribonuclease P protein subunit RPR2
MKHKKDDKKERKRIALERINYLLDESKKTVKKDEILANRYVLLSTKLQTKYNISLNSEQKKSFCKKCLTPFADSSSYRVRLTGKTIVYTCMKCGAYSRFGYK